MTYQDKGVGFPVGRGDLVGKPGGDSFGGFDAELGHGLRNVFDPIQQPLGGVVVVFQKTIRLKRRRKTKMIKLASTVSVVQTPVVCSHYNHITLTTFNRNKLMYCSKLLGAWRIALSV